MSKKTADKNIDPAKAAAKTAVTVAASASVIVGGLFSSPADLVRDPEGPGIDRTFPPAAVELLKDETEEEKPSDESEGGGGTPDDDRKDDGSVSGGPGLRENLRGAVRSVPKAVRAIAGIPMWIAGWLITGAFRAAWGGVLSPLLNFIVGWLVLSAFVLLAVVCAVKAVFPDLPLRKILNRRTLLAVLICCGVLSAADTFLPLFWSEYRKISRIVRIAGSGLTAVCVSLPFFRHRMRRRARAEARAQQQ